ncbi:MAG TPA: glutathione S-transferase family protein [Rhizomicrobium sp.]|jgi:glutathione S-transferase|nr:glutathione S-transferase family protein [Rhizomicrobium sp.]
MILVGQYDSPYTRRVAISLKLLGLEYEHDKRSVFGDFDSMRITNPLGRVPSLILDGGETLIDSAAILDWLDEKVGPERALLPANGRARQRALQLIALATGAFDKIGAANYERLIRPPAFRWPAWIERSLTQGAGAIEALEHADWQTDGKINQPMITIACMLDYVRLTDPGLTPPGKYKKLDSLLQRFDALPAFMETSVSEYAVPRG